MNLAAGLLLLVKDAMSSWTVIKITEQASPAQARYIPGEGGVSCQAGVGVSAGAVWLWMRSVSGYGQTVQTGSCGEDGLQACGLCPGMGSLAGS